MKYIRINKWDQFQHYTDGRRVKWIKLLVEIIDEFDEKGEPKKFHSLPDAAKLTFTMLACLRARYTEKIPYKSDKQLRQSLGINRLSLAPLEKAGFITVSQDGTDLVRPCTKTVPLDRDRDRDRDREGEKRAYGEFHHVKLSNDDLRILYREYGKTRITQMITSLDEYIENKGKRYKNHRITIKNWLKRDGQKKRTEKEQHDSDLRNCMHVFSITAPQEWDRAMDKLYDNYGKRATDEALMLMKNRRRKDETRDKWI